MAARRLRRRRLNVAGGPRRRRLAQAPAYHRCTMLEQRIQQQFFDSADLQYRSAETLHRPIAEAAAALLSAITNGGK